MKAELLAIKTALQDGLPYVAAADIFVAEDLNQLRPVGGYPAIGLKDGNSAYTIEAGDQQDVEADITLAVYVKPAANEAGIIGATGFKGVHEIAADIMALLRHNLLGGLVETAVPVAVSGSEQVSDGNKIIIMVTITMHYSKFDQL